MCVTGECGGVVNLASGASHTIKSPGYDNDRFYLSYQGCNWWIKVTSHLLLVLFLSVIVTVKVLHLSDL